MPHYAIFAKTAIEGAGPSQVVTFVHQSLAARALQIPLTAMPRIGVVTLLNEILQQLQVIRCIDVRTEKPVLFINIYNFTSDSSREQRDMLDLLRVVLETWAPRCDLIYVGGDFNATLVPRHGYSDSTVTGRSNTLLQEFLSSSPLVKPLHPKEHTWRGCLGQEATLDMWLVSSTQSSELHVIPLCHPSHDHRIIHTGLPLSVVSPLSDTSLLATRPRLKMTAWRKKKGEWAERTTEALATRMSIDAAPTDQADVVLQCALSVAKVVMGCSKPRKESHILQRSSAVLRLIALISTLKVAVSDIEKRREHSLVVRNEISRVMQRVWDMGLRPDELPYAIASSLGQHAMDEQEVVVRTRAAGGWSAY